LPVPQSLSIITIGARDLGALREFYLSWGWRKVAESTESWCAFDVGGCLLSIYPVDLLGDEAAPGLAVGDTGWNGITLAMNFATETELAAVFESAVESGATVVCRPMQRAWGGISGYIADPEGNRWELAHSPTH